MNVRDNLAAGKYENKVPYSIEQVPVNEETMTVRQAREHKESEKRRASDQKTLHREEDHRLIGLLQSDLEIEHGVAGKPIAAKLWSLAYDRGHAHGNNGIIDSYEEFAELIKEMLATYSTPEQTK